MAQFSSAPPLKILKSEATPPPDWASATLRNHSRKNPHSPGRRDRDPARTTTIIASVKRTRLRSSGILKMLVNAEIIDGRRQLARSDSTPESRSRSYWPVITMVPPAFSIFFLAEALMLSTSRWNFLLTSPRPRIFTPPSEPRTSPAPRRSSSLMAAPSSKRFRDRRD